VHGAAGPRRPLGTVTVMTTRMRLLAMTLVVGVALHVLMLVSHLPIAPPAPPAAVAAASIDHHAVQHASAPGETSETPAGHTEHVGHVLACLAILAIGLAFPSRRSAFRRVVGSRSRGPGPLQLVRSWPPPRAPSRRLLTPVSARVVLLT
jgi:hypothetical protein